MSSPNRYGPNSAKAQVVYVCNFGQGSLYISDTAAHVGPFSSITALAAAVFDVVNNGVTITSVPLPAGTTIYGNFTALTLASGKVMAYN